MTELLALQLDPHIKETHKEVPRRHDSGIRVDKRIDLRPVKDATSGSSLSANSTPVGSHPHESLAYLETFGRRASNDEAIFHPHWTHSSPSPTTPTPATAHSPDFSHSEQQRPRPRSWSLSHVPALRRSLSEHSHQSELHRSPEIADLSGLTAFEKRVLRLMEERRLARIREEHEALDKEKNVEPQADG